MLLHKFIMGVGAEVELGTTMHKRNFEGFNSCNLLFCFSFVNIVTLQPTWSSTYVKP
jgi:hypothetical protein